MDSRKIDDEIHDLLSVEPSPEFTARVRTSIGTAPIASSVPRSLAVLGGIVAMAVLAVAMSAFWPGEPEPRVSSTPSTAPAAPAPVKMSAPSAIQTSVSVATSVRRGRRPTATTPASHAPDFPDVMLSPDDRRSFHEALASAGARRFEVSPEGVQALMDTSIQEIVIAPVNVFTSEQGAQQ